MSNNSVTVATVECDMDLLTVQIVKLEDENTRQSIGCLLVALTSGVKLGEGMVQSMEYAISDEIDRRILTAKIIELLKRL